MKRAERVAALEALLARVQANAGMPRVARGRSVAADLPLHHGASESPRAAASPMGLGPPGAAASRTAEAASIAPLPQVTVGARPPGDAVDLGDWSSLLERDLRDPSPASPAPPPVVVAHALATARRPSQPPPLADPALVDAAPGGARAELAEPPPPSRRAAVDVDDEPPASELERAIQAAVAGGASPVDARRLWTEAASELRGRRSHTSPDEPEPGGPALLDAAVPHRPEAPRLEATTSGAPAAAHLASPAPLIVHDDAEEAPRGRRVRRASRGRRATAIPVVAVVVVAAAVVTWWLGERRPTETPTTARDAAVARGTTSAAATAPTTSPTVPPAATPRAAASPAATSPAATSAAATASGPTTPGPLADAPPIARPFDHGLLRVDADPVSDVYLQGIRSGETGRWLEVPCGARNVRLARPGAPPPGHSFPMWLGTGRTLHVPCGGTQTFRWTWD